MAPVVTFILAFVVLNAPVGTTLGNTGRIRSESDAHGSNLATLAAVPNRRLNVGVHVLCISLCGYRGCPPCLIAYQ